MNPDCGRLTLRGVSSLVALMAGSVVIGMGSAWSAPITFNTALPVAKNEFLVREQFIINRSSDDPTNLNRNRTAKAAVSVGVLPPSVQVGSGSWDPLLGVVSTYQTLDYQIDGQISYQINNEANDFEAGDVARLDASLQYRLWPRTLGGGVPAFFYGVIEANLVHQQKNQVNGQSNPNSGGTRLFLTPGIQYVTRRWIAETAIQVPVVQNLNGDALENDYIARVSVRFNF